mmetsp:Transcript_101930/g.247746  ORF Transcript_101930/g.247746 Transcript_101930/m.247746 type:complete len:216 (+) Transcript_101930:1933-2580(+)
MASSMCASRSPTTEIRHSVCVSIIAAYSISGRSARPAPCSSVVRLVGSHSAYGTAVTVMVASSSPVRTATMASSTARCMRMSMENEPRWACTLSLSVEAIQPRNATVPLAWTVYLMLPVCSPARMLAALSSNTTMPFVRPGNASRYAYRSSFVSKPTMLAPLPSSDSAGSSCGAAARSHPRREATVSITESISGTPAGAYRYSVHQASGMTLPKP